MASRSRRVPAHIRRTRAGPPKNYRPVRRCSHDMRQLDGPEPSLLQRSLQCEPGPAKLSPPTAQRHYVPGANALAAVSGTADLVVMMTKLAPAPAATAAGPATDDPVACQDRAPRPGHPERPRIPEAAEHPDHGAEQGHSQPRSPGGLPVRREPR